MRQIKLTYILVLEFKKNQLNSLLGFSSHNFLAPPFCSRSVWLFRKAALVLFVFEQQLLNYCFWFQLFPEVLIPHLTSPPGAIVTSSSTSSTPIRLVSLRMAST